MAFRRTVIEAVGWFDLELGAGARIKSAEDSDYIQRASEAGFTGIYTPDPLIWHHHGRKAADVPALNRGYYRGWGAFCASVLARRPSMFWKAMLHDFQASPSVLAYAKKLYWEWRRWPMPRCWNVLRGAVEFSFVLAKRRRNVSEDTAS